MNTEEFSISLDAVWSGFLLSPQRPAQSEQGAEQTTLGYAAMVLCKQGAVARVNELG